nr:MAG TPA: hypothetical protein [Caudoviricetes sp.]
MSVCVCCNRMSYTVRRVSQSGTSSTRTIGVRSTRRTNRLLAALPPFAEALVRKNLPELCQSKQIAT